jgi:hypothetical protein
MQMRRLGKVTQFFVHKVAVINSIIPQYRSLKNLGKYWLCHRRQKIKTCNNLYMSHLHVFFSTPLKYRYPTSSTCCHIHSSISTPWLQSQSNFPRNCRVQMILCAVLLKWLLMLWCTLSQFWVFLSAISVLSAFIVCAALLFTVHSYVSCILYCGILSR